ncbi:hypothetical protein C8J56DRAFT_181866 [Mycena floridula]|nr:hypothetical protein C8J56DRAFT_181866 [Mycena floridula]
MKLSNDMREISDHLVSLVESEVRNKLSYSQYRSNRIIQGLAITLQFLQSSEASISADLARVGIIRSASGQLDFDQHAIDVLDALTARQNRLARFGSTNPVVAIPPADPRYLIKILRDLTVVVDNACSTWEERYRENVVQKEALRAQQQVMTEKNRHLDQRAVKLSQEVSIVHGMLRLEKSRTDQAIREANQAKDEKERAELGRRNALNSCDVFRKQIRDLVYTVDKETAEKAALERQIQELQRKFELERRASQALGEQCQALSESNRRKQRRMADMRRNAKELDELAKEDSEDEGYMSPSSATPYLLSPMNSPPGSGKRPLMEESDLHKPNKMPRLAS